MLKKKNENYVWKKSAKFSENKNQKLQPLAVGHYSMFSPKIQRVKGKAGVEAYMDLGAWRTWEVFQGTRWVHRTYFENLCARLFTALFLEGSLLLGVIYRVLLLYVSLLLSYDGLS